MHIVFKVFPAHSHLNSTFNLALSLKAKNYNITYVGIKDFEKDVLAQGFNYFVDDDVFPRPVPTTKKYSFFKRLKIRKQYKKLHDTYLKGTGFDNIINCLNPDMIVVDSPYVRHSIPLLNKDIPFVIFESMVALNKAPLHPPLSSKIIATNSLSNNLFIKISWKQYFFRSFLERLLFGRVFPSNNLIKKLAATTNFPVEEIDFDRYFHIGLKNIPEIIASPLEFDFPLSKRSNQYYIGTYVNVNRKESSYDFKYHKMRDYIEKMSNHNQLCDPNEKVALIYCSFGSMAWRYEGVSDFYEKLIDVFKNDLRVQIFISIGYELSYHLFRDLPPNIHVFRKVPQMELLKKVDLMITHGGMNTITECILSDVPMLVYPGNNKIDQVGNACRVVFHKMGFMGNLKKESQKSLKRKVLTLLSKDDFKNNVIEMKNKILSSGGSDEVLFLIDELIHKSKQNIIAAQI